jgi:NADH pyrophosphatase NudC (nudix superfamily)
MMVRDRKMRNINCPRCGKPMKKHRKKAEYVCTNPRCPVIFVRIHHGGMRRVGVEPRLNEYIIIK